MQESAALQELRQLITNRVIRYKNTADPIVGPANTREEWIFDFRAVLLEEEFLRLFVELFWHKCGHLYPFQVGGLETVSIALTTAIVQSGAARGTPVTGFYIRKSRKPYGLQKKLEGRVSDLPVILLDDLINSGDSVTKQIQVLAESAPQAKVAAFFACVRFRPEVYYSYLTYDHNVTLLTLFTLDDFNLSYEKYPPPPDRNSFHAEWKLGAPDPELFHRLPKSAPVLDETKLYFGSDNGTLWAVDQAQGREVWGFKMRGRGVMGKTIFSSPALSGNTIFFGAYDGNFYALDKETGQERWVYTDADYIGSSPCIAEDLGLVYVGLEYGLWRKRGGIVALDLMTGKKKWEYIAMPQHTHGSPAYSTKFGVVVVGSNDGVLYCFEAQTGALRWQLQTGGEIKMAPAFDEARGYVTVGSFDGQLYIVRVADGTVAYSWQTDAAIFSTPCIHQNKVYFSSLDKYIYCVDLIDFNLVWKYGTNGRVFASPVVAEGMLYCGSNDGVLYEISPATGACTSVYQTTERITNKIAYNQKTKYIYLPTYANEIYCLKKKEN